MAAPKGNNFAGNALVAKKALEHSLLKHEGNEPSGEKASRFNALVEIWDVQISKAVEGDNQSAAMIIDRMDGKAGQAIVVEADLTVKEVKDLSDDELANIASEGS